MLQPFISWRDNVTTFSVGGITLQHFELAQKSRDKSRTLLQATWEYKKIYDEDYT